MNDGCQEVFIQTHLILLVLTLSRSLLEWKALLVLLDKDKE